MARELKDQMEGSEEVVIDEPRQLHPLQIPVDEDMETKILDFIRSDYTAANDARDKKDYGTTSKGDKLDFDTFNKKIKDLYTGEREPKDTPWKFCSNRSVRIATSIVDTLHARILPTIVNRDLLRWTPGTQMDVPKVERIEKLMKWWLWVRSEVQGFFDIWVKSTIGYGDTLTETGWDVETVDTGETVTQPIMDEQGSPVMEQDGNPAQSQFRNLNFIERTKSKTFTQSQYLLQDGSCDIYKEPVIIEETILFRDLEEGEVSGKFINVSTALRNILPTKQDSSGFENDKYQRLRDIEVRNQQVKIQRIYMHFDADGDGFPEDCRFVTCLDHNIYLGGIQVKNLTKTGKRPLWFQKFDNRFDKPTENFGEGVLEKVMELSEEIDAIFNQLTDANTLSVLRPGFYDPAGDLDAKILTLSPNKLSPVSDPSRNLAFPDISVNIQQLLASIKMVLEFVERLTAASAFVFGKEGEFAGGSGTATRTNAIMQSAEIRFEIPATRLRRGAAAIVRQHLDVLQLNIPPGLETRVLGEKGDPVFETNELTQDGISGDYDAYLLIDPSQGSKQMDRDLAGMFYSILLQNPLIGTDPIKIYRVTADLLKAWDKDPVAYLGPAPLSDDIDDPEDENTLIIQGDFGRVTPQITENHILHMQKHMELMQSPTLAQLPSHLLQQVQQFTQQHIQGHQQMMQLMMTIQQQFGGGGAGNAGKSQGGETRGIETDGGSPIAQGMEQTTGPLAQALDRKRAGESGLNP